MKERRNIMEPAKYKPGDLVYFATSEYSLATIPCPDCEGTLKWAIRFADDHEEEIDCQTCKKGFEGSKGYIEYNKWTPSVRLLTIKKIHEWKPEEGYSYLCDETITGPAGRIHRENDLFIDKKQAEALAEERYVSRMKNLAKNNFSKKFQGKEKLERLLSTVGFVRSERLLKAYEFIRWAEVSELIGKTETKRQYSKIKIENLIKEGIR